MRIDLWLAFWVFGAASAAFGQAAPPASQATVPLDEILRLHRELDRRGEERTAPPPLPASLDRMMLSGRLLPDGLDIAVAAQVSVLAENEWVFVPLLQKDPSTHLTGFEPVADGVITVRDGWLGFATRSAGTHPIKFSFLKGARPGKAGLCAEIRPGAATLSTLRLQWDDELLQLLDAPNSQGPDGAELFPARGVFSPCWRPRALPAARVTPETRRAPRESGILEAFASVVSTLEGRRIVRVLYNIRLGEQKELALSLPPGMSLKRMYLNGSALPVPAESGAASSPALVSLAPGRQGDESAQLELTLEENPGVFPLSGRLRVTLPESSWPVDRYRARLHLPAVFNYAWAGGSLAPAGEPQGEDRPWPEFTEAIPTPGKSLDLVQELVNSAPGVEVAFTVDLAGQYFEP